ncbi:MAG: arylsulfatase [Cytophagales bacterium]|nr:arylsulfatase [Cytophagales bacterium]
MRVSVGYFSLFIIGASLMAGCSSPEKARPNILLIVADDLGYTDLGCYGGEIHTPNMDALAARGVRFTQFHTAPSCAPSRAMLLSGNNNHVAGMGRQGGASPGSWQNGQPGYEGYLSDRIIPMPRLLRNSGYHTYTAGKWHLGKKEEHSPASKGFERSFSLLQGAGNHYNSIGLESRDSISFYSADGTRVPYPTGKYSTELYTDKLIEFIKTGKDGNAFFAYAAYTSPHWPLQVPAAFDRYRGKYDMGYDSLRKMRFDGLKAAGLVPAASRLPPQQPTVKPWNDLTVEERRIESRKMELYAAMVDNLDYHIGRLVKFLKDDGLFENTIIVFMSDNGAANEDFFDQPPHAAFLQRNYDNSYDNMGSPTSFISYGTAWAKAGTAPFHGHKYYTTEGGIAAPFIVSGHEVKGHGTIRDEFVTVMDIAPTFLELAGVAYPERIDSRPIAPMLGESMNAYLTGRSNHVHDSSYVVGLELNGRAYFRKGDWKIVNIEGPHREETFRLFNLKNDPAETTDLRVSQPQRMKEMLEGWRAYREKHGILIGPPG